MVIDNEIFKGGGRNNISRNNVENSIIINYKISENYNFNWNNVQILNKEILFFKICISEMLFIRRQINNLDKEIYGNAKQILGFIFLQ